MLKKAIYLIFIFTAFGFTGYSFYQYSLAPCDKPLEYAIGRFDTEFGVTPEQFKAEIAKAEAVWEKALGRDIFIYDPDAKFKINLIYDERQRVTDQKQKVEFGLDAVEKTFQTLDAKFKSFKSGYDSQKAAYENQVADFEKRQKDYSEKVNFWNARGGAPKAEYENLETESQYLKSEADRLNTTVAGLNTMSKELNNLLDERNAAAENYNKIAKSYNEKYGEGLEFDQANYTEKEINVYQFGGKGDLDLALAHELGHALGMEHVLNAASIMYPVSSTEVGGAVSPSVEDLAELRRVCPVVENGIEKLFQID